MAYLEEALRKKEKELKEIEARMKGIRREGPEGTLQVSTIRGCYRYYRNLAGETGEESVREYLPQKEHSLAAQMAQGEYDKSFCRELDRQLHMVQRMLKNYDSQRLSDTYEKMHPGKKIFVKPYHMGDEAFRKQWIEKAYEKNPYPFDEKEVLTEGGERVRSKSEAFIADRLRQYGIPYRYEAALATWGGKVLYPDFTILNVRKRTIYYWEHFGRMDDPEYVNKQCIKKLEEMREMGIFPGKNLICTFESTAYPFAGRGVNDLIEEFLI